MFYPSDFEVKLNKEQEIRERVHQAAIDQLARELRPSREGFYRWAGRLIQRYLSHRLNRRSAVALPKIELARPSNAVQKA